MLSCASSYLKLHDQLQKVTQCVYMVHVIRLIIWFESVQPRLG